MDPTVQHYIDNAMYDSFEEWTKTVTDYSQLIPYFKLSNVDFFAEYSHRGYMYCGHDHVKSTILMCAITNESRTYEEEFTPGFTQALIATGKSHPEVQDETGRTALMRAIYYAYFENSIKEIALALIATGKSNPGAQDQFGKTALMTVCFYYPEKSIFDALLATGESNIEAVSNHGWTALMHLCACSFNEECEMAHTLLATDKCNLESKLCDGHTALTLAFEHQLYDVAWSIATKMAIKRRNPAIIAMYLEY
jgi:ankyrin repeat protein